MKHVITNELVTSTRIAKKYFPIRGIDSDVGGMLSLYRSMNTVRPRNKHKLVITRVILEFTGKLGQKY